jgi:hypothetical protein
MSNSKNKIVVNLSDIDKNPVFIHNIPKYLFLCKEYSNNASMYMVQYALYVTEHNNQILGVYPNPKTKTRKIF